MRFAFGGTPPVAERARALGSFFERPSSMAPRPPGGGPGLRSLASGRPPPREEDYPHTLLERIRWKAPYPLLRHHFGLPTMAGDLRGIEPASPNPSVLDVDLPGDRPGRRGTFFHPERQEKRRSGAGGVPVRSPEDYRSLYEATRRGNFP